MIANLPSMADALTAGAQMARVLGNGYGLASGTSPWKGPIPVYMPHSGCDEMLKDADLIESRTRFVSRSSSQLTARAKMRV
jgi:hypothetical protein